MSKEKNKEIKVFVREDTYVKINGKKIKVKKGKHELDKNIAKILIEAGYADEL